MDPNIGRYLEFAAQCSAGCLEFFVYGEHSLVSGWVRNKTPLLSDIVPMSYPAEVEYSVWAIVSSVGLAYFLGGHASIAERGDMLLEVGV